MRNATLVCSREVVKVTHPEPVHFLVSFWPSHDLPTLCATVTEASKGLEAEKIFTLMAENGKHADFVLCIGDDRSDEDMFKIIGNAISGNMLSVNTNVFACTSGQKPRKAKYYLDDTSEVILLLENLAEATDSPVI
ncbi:probable alpha,alpha-trehalose-phosphate synthase [UDP-forming] 7 [Tanacetum coccineum]